MSESAPSVTLLSIPTEIRLLIWSYVFGDLVLHPPWFQRDKDISRNTGVFRVNRRIRREAKEIFRRDVPLLLNQTSLLLRHLGGRKSKRELPKRYGDINSELKKIQDLFEDWSPDCDRRATSIQRQLLRSNTSMGKLLREQRVIFLHINMDGEHCPANSVYACPITCMLPMWLDELAHAAFGTSPRKVYLMLEGSCMFLAEMPHGLERMEQIRQAFMELHLSAFKRLFRAAQEQVKHKIYLVRETRGKVWLDDGYRSSLAALCDEFSVEHGSRFCVCPRTAYGFYDGLLSYDHGHEYYPLRLYSDEGMPLKKKSWEEWESQRFDTITLQEQEFLERGQPLPLPGPQQAAYTQVRVIVSTDDGFMQGQQAVQEMDPQMREFLRMYGLLPTGRS
ncbi:hypothetical protein MRB53_038610 [Persea americana]|nr:hypothetical protein MRB53_038610 [Persea americana]